MEDWKFTLFSELSELPVVTVVTLLVAVLLVAVMAVLLVRAYRRRAEAVKTPAAPQNGTRALVYGALCVALSFILSYIKFFEMPQGGSITLCSILPVALYANWFGTRRGLLVGLAFGLLQFLQKPIAVHWAQPILDYALAFTCIGLAGSFPKSLPVGILVGGIGRILCSTVSGAIFFAEYAPEGMNAWIYSTIYNTISLGPDMLICIVVALIAPVRRALNQLSPKPGKVANGNTGEARM